MARKIIQISESIVPETQSHPLFWSLTALCDDGTLWNKAAINDAWVQIPNVPQDKTPEATNE
jgi:hypothetical protein|uniref:Uncharacterized protein n=1 Tax=Podoviridae sp. ct4s49 TaxID=2823555 RepID=A0A8S5LEE0_9CAUD|nr:MAG TPA: hypothetical protein [Podoviridae sp. ct4s49]